MPLSPTPSPLYCWPSLPLPVTVDLLSVVPTACAISMKPARALPTRREFVTVTEVPALICTPVPALLVTVTPSRVTREDVSTQTA